MHWFWYLYPLWLVLAAGLGRLLVLRNRRRQRRRYEAWRAEQSDWSA